MKNNLSPTLLCNIKWNAVPHYNIWNLTVFSSVLNPNHCRSVLNSLLCSLHNWSSVVLVFSAILASSRSIMEIMRCVKFIRCPIWLHSMLSSANQSPTRLEIYSKWRPRRSRERIWEKDWPRPSRKSKLSKKSLSNNITTQKHRYQH